MSCRTQESCSHSILPTYYKEYYRIQINNQMEMWGQEQRSFCPCGTWSLARCPWKCSGSPSRSSHEPPSFVFFIETLLRRHDWLNHWPLMIYAIFSPLLSLDMCVCVCVCVCIILFEKYNQCWECIHWILINK